MSQIQNPPPPAGPTPPGGDKNPGGMPPVAELQGRPIGRVLTKMGKVAPSRSLKTSACRSR